jgi:uncharacterized membrane protein
MTLPTLFGLPIHLAFLYFIVYSFLGWCQETIYCSVMERRLVPRGFLYGPLCPIYGVGVLMMICWFQPLMGNPILFYLVATVCMSAWEYLVGWFLETTTHIKYWDYSQYRFNLKGRICLWVCLVWGVLSFIILYFIHPRVADFLSPFRSTPLYFLDGVLLGILIADTAATIYQLVRTSQMLAKLQQAGDELRVQVHLGKAELDQRMDEVKERLEDLVPDQSDEKGRALKERYDELMARTEIMSRRFRHSYGHMRASGPVGEALDSVKRRGARLKTHMRERKLRQESQATK